MYCQMTEIARCASSDDPMRDELIKAADQCVMCGMCLPACPTYMKTRDEAESPRGRISLIQALLQGRLAPDSALRRHLDSCLTCRACERICPSGVPYGRIIDGAHALLRQQKPARGWMLEQLLETTASPKRLRLGAKMLQIARLSGTQKLVQRGLQSFSPDAALWKEFMPAELPEIRHWQASYPAVGPMHGKVALFTGCIANIVDQQTLRDAVTLLTRCGYEVDVPSAQVCCGALHHHAGDLTRAQRLAAQNLSAFDISDVDAIIFTASGCGAHLTEYGEHGDAGTRAAEFSGRCREISQFLLECGGLERLAFKPLSGRVAVHEPCTQRNVLKQCATPYRLLEHIPQIDLRPLPGNQFCCGAAGSYMLEHPEMARSLREDKLKAISKIGTQILASSNIGCILHIAAGLRQQGQSVEVMHPVSVLARQLAG